MFRGFTEKTTEFLAGIRDNNNKEWFEEHKEMYTEEVYEPLCELAEELKKAFADKDDVICKPSRIYQDASFPPYEHYRSTMYIYILRDAMHWNQVPLLYAELSAAGIVCGFRISKPLGYVIDNFRKALIFSPDKFKAIIHKLREKHNVSVSGDLYKRMKPCSDKELAEFYLRKNLNIFTVINGKDVYSKELPERLAEILTDCYALCEFFYPLMELNLDCVQTEQTDQAILQSAQNEHEAVQADSSPIAEKYGGFMW